MEYYVFWSTKDGMEEGMSDEPFEKYEDALAEIEKMKAEDKENGEEGAWEYRVEEKEEDGDGDDDEDDGSWECGYHPDERSVVVAGRGGRGSEVRRFGSSYEREMWEIGMRESDFI